MIKEKHSYKRVIAWGLGVALLAPLFIYAVDPPNIKDILLSENKKGVIVSQDEEARIAAEISNITGVTTSKIHQLRQEGYSWNQLLTYLSGADLAEDTNSRSAQLLRAGLSDEFMARLLEEGFSSEEIQEARILSERLQFNLLEIVRGAETAVAPLAGDEHQEQNKSLQTLYNSFSLEEAISLILKLEKGLGSKSAALEEYITSLQLDIKLMDFIGAWEEYEALKADRMMLTEVVTLQEIEELMLAALYQGNTANELPEGSLIENNSITETTTEEKLLPPAFEEIKPHNPAQQIMDEINQLNPNIQRRSVNHE